MVKAILAIPAFIIIMIVACLCVGWETVSRLVMRIWRRIENQIVGWWYSDYYKHKEILGVIFLLIALLSILFKQIAMAGMVMAMGIIGFTVWIEKYK